MVSTTSRALRHLRLNKTIRQPQQRRHNSTYDFSHLTYRTIPPIFSTLSPDSSYRLDTTLTDFLPPTSHTPPFTLPSTTATTQNVPHRDLPLAHHLLYFEPTNPSSVMLPDGTNPDHFPGGPFVRRMWAGGSVRWNHDRPLKLDGGVGVCAEFIRDVQLKEGKEADQEKVFVSIERRIATAKQDEIDMLAEAAVDLEVKGELEHRVRQRLWRDQEEDFGACSIVEGRKIVFLRGPTPEQPTRGASRYSNPEHASSSSSFSYADPHFAHTVIPDARLLFRYSALTFNAHSIHLDPLYAREIEGHRNLLVHGPLSLTFLITLLQHHLSSEGNQVVQSIEYRNTKALYCDEEVTFYGKPSGEKKWEVWAEDKSGGIGVRGRVKVE